MGYISRELMSGTHKFGFAVFADPQDVAPRLGIIRDTLLIIMVLEGIVIVLLQLDQSSKELITDPDLITRGFVYIKGQEHLLDEAKKD